MSNKYKILLVEDDKNIRYMVRTILESNMYQVIEAEGCSNALSMITSHVPDLIVLDLGLPDGDGMSILEKVRQEALTPIIVLSARTGERDKVDALDKGANDYITKPFSSPEFMARVRSALRFGRHSAEEGKLSGKFQLRDLTILYDSRQVFIGETQIKLTQTEFNIMSVLSHHPGKVLTYSAIIKAVWGSADDGSVKKLQVNLANIRKKLGEHPGDRRYISNELGVGYRMMTDDS